MESANTPAAPRGFWQRRATRRGVLAGGAALAAAGAGAAVFGITALQEDDAAPATPGDTPGAESTPRAEADLDRPIADARRAAAHLLRRAGFGGNARDIDEFARLPREEAVGRLLDFAGIDNAALDARVATANFELNDFGNGLVADAQRWWLTRMAYTARPLEERMTYIWHGLLTTQLSKLGPQRAKLLVQQNELFRSMALPKYGDLLKAVSRDPAMMFYLDTAESTKEHPNENYARELMELFSMGVGNYTEDDVRESARAFTGWRVTAPPRPDVRQEGLTQEERQRLLRESAAAWEPRFFVNPRQHDSGTKTFLGQVGPFDGDAIVDIIMRQPATARFMCTRLFMEFAHYNPSPQTIDALAATWERTGGDVREVVHAILVSDEFWSERAYRGFVRSPVELVVGLVRAFEIETDFRAVVNRQYGYQAMDQALFEPPSVAGWPGGSAWLSSSTFFARTNFLDYFLLGAIPARAPAEGQRRPAAGNRTAAARPLALPALQGTASTEEALDRALDLLVDGVIGPRSREAILAHVRGIANRDERLATIAYLVAASPENQLA